MSTRHVALVTGADRGIGAALAERLARDGCAVLATYHGTGDAAEVAARITGHAVAVPADLMDASTVPPLFERAERELGPVDVLVHNATGSLQDTFRAQQRDWMGRALTPVSAETVDRSFGVDVRAGAALIAEFARRLEVRGGEWGRIVTMVSGGEKGWPGEVSYGAAKAALLNYTLSAGLELSRYGVTANAVHPPVTDTGWVNDEVRELVARDDRFFSVAEPSEVADLVAFLVSDAGRRVTGNVIRMG